MISRASAGILLALLALFLSVNASHAIINELTEYSYDPKYYTILNTENEAYVGLANPSAVYCRELGYTYEKIKTPEGETGNCMLPKGLKCSSWDFLKGKCGKEYSYCAKQGMETIEGSDEAVCLKNGKEQGKAGKLMKLIEKARAGKPRNTKKSSGLLSLTESKGEEYTGNPLGEPPASFDWRNVNGSNWVTIVKDQGGCGSCWAFSAIGAIESYFEVSNGDPNINANLSEQYLVSTCFDGGDCDGGWQNEAIDYASSEGVPDEECYPYLESNSLCSSRCNDWLSRLNYSENAVKVSNDILAIKQALIDKGPLAVALRIDGWYTPGTVYACTTDSPVNHAVLLVGYDENGWIIKNSWGDLVGKSRILHCRIR